MNCEYLITSNRERFLGVQLVLSEKHIPHRIRIRSFPKDQNGKPASLFTIYIDQKNLAEVKKYFQK